MKLMRRRGMWLFFHLYETNHHLGKREFKNQNFKISMTLMRRRGYVVVFPSILNKSPFGNQGIQSAKGLCFMLFFSIYMKQNTTLENGDQKARGQFKAKITKISIKLTRQRGLCCCFSIYIKQITPFGYFG